MFSTEVRITITTLVAPPGFGVAALAPAASQAQWHTICDSAGHCTTHQNFTIGGKDPCGVIQSNYKTSMKVCFTPSKHGRFTSTARARARQNKKERRK